MARLSYIVNIIIADDLQKSEARASAAMALSWSSMNSSALQPQGKVL